MCVCVCVCRPYYYIGTSSDIQPAVYLAKSIHFTASYETAAALHVDAMNVLQGSIAGSGSAGAALEAAAAGGHDGMVQVGDIL